jgi:hypothetical protein
MLSGPQTIRLAGRFKPNDEVGGLKKPTRNSPLDLGLRFEGYGGACIPLFAFLDVSYYFIIILLNIQSSIPNGSVAKRYFLFLAAQVFTTNIYNPILSLE